MVSVAVVRWITPLPKPVKRAVTSYLQFQGPALLAGPPRLTVCNGNTVKDVLNTIVPLKPSMIATLTVTGPYAYALVKSQLMNSPTLNRIGGVVQTSCAASTVRLPTATRRTAIIPATVSASLCFLMANILHPACFALILSLLLSQHSVVMPSAAGWNTRPGVR